MKKRVWIVWILVSVLVSMYATTARSTVNSVDIYFVSYTIGKLYAMTYIVAGVVAVVLWGCVIYFFVKHRKQWISELKAKKVEKKQGMIRQTTVFKLAAKEKAKLETKSENVAQPPEEVSKEVEKVETKEETKTKIKTETKKEELKAEVKLEKKCTSCGAILEENAKFCTKCGNKVT